jgi:Brp/Blh family beta-carotene 15,15'-monooxygenase
MKRIKFHALRRQGIAFSLLTCIVLLLLIVFPVWNSSVETAVLATLIFFLGLPHGALDVIFAKRLYSLVSLGQWAVFCVAYVALAAAVVGFWWIFPAAFLTAFLLMSAFHFSGDLDRGTSLFLRFWYAGSMLIFPAWFHEADVARLFSALVAGNFSMQLAYVLQAMALPWCVGLGITLMFQFRINWVTGLEVLSVSLLAIAAPPLLSFTVFFCVMHSARHALRTQAYAVNMPWVDLLKKATAPMAACALAGVLLWPTLAGLTFETAVVRILFVALAALTVPHMVLIERVRLAGWQDSKSSKV